MNCLKCNEPVNGNRTVVLANNIEFAICECNAILYDSNDNTYAVKREDYFREKSELYKPEKQPHW